MLLVKLFRLSAADRRLVMETLILLGLARAAVMILPFRWLAGILGQREKSAAAKIETSAALPASQIRRIAWAVRRIACHTPWRSNCLAKAVAGRFMLRRRQIASTLYFGMIKDSEGRLAAHAWLKSGDVVLTGGSNLDRYTIVATFTD